MNRFTEQEQLTLFIGMFLVMLIIIGKLFFLLNFEVMRLFLGGITIIASLIIIYGFVIQPMKSKLRPKSLYNQYFTSTNESFRPTIVKPLKIVKKTKMKGLCEYCRQKALMGFTCSYCNGYYCPEHRLPEKHDCLKIKIR